MPVDYYLQGNPATANLRSVLPAVPWSVVRPYVELYTIPSAARMTQIERSCPRLWVIASHQGHTPGPVASERDLMRYHTLLHGLHHAYRHSSRRQFGYAAPIYVTRFSVNGSQAGRRYGRRPLLTNVIMLITISIRVLAVSSFT